MLNLYIRQNKRLTAAINNITIIIIYFNNHFMVDRIFNVTIDLSKLSIGFLYGLAFNTLVTLFLYFGNLIK